MTPAQARRLIAQRADEAAPIPHARQRMIVRRIDLLSVIRCLKGGTITEGPYRDIGSGNWRCSVDGTVAGQNLRIVVEIPADGLLIITAIVRRR